MSDIYAITEHQSPDELDDISYEMLDAGSQLADTTGDDLVAVVLGNNTDRLTDELGAADRILRVEHERLAEFNPMTYSEAVQEVIDAADPRIVLSSITSIGLDIASRVEAETGRPVVTYVSDIEHTDADDLVVTSQLYGGKMNVESRFESDAAIVALAAGAYDADAGRMSGTPESEFFDVSLNRDGIDFVDRHEPETGDVDITQEDRLLAIGRGIDDEENIPIARETAAALDSELASSRPLIDNGWLPKARQVGKSGQKVDPELYIAAGISGAPEHLEGMEDAEVIVAINDDDEAPIFDHADYGIPHDLFDVLPAVQEKA